MVKLKLADNITKCRCTEVFYCRYGTFNAIGVKLRICYLKENNRVYLHCNVIFCDNRLGRKVHNLLFERNDFGNSFKNRHFNMKSCLPCGAVCSETFDNIRL